MLTIKLSRTGKKKYALYRIIISEKARDPWGRNLENLGTYDPHAKKAELKAERIKYWIGRGAQTTATVHNLLVSQNVISGEKVRASGSKMGKKKREAAVLKKGEIKPEKGKEETKPEEAEKEVSGEKSEKVEDAEKQEPKPEKTKEEISSPTD